VSPMIGSSPIDLFNETAQEFKKQARKMRIYSRFGYYITHRMWHETPSGP